MDLFEALEWLSKNPGCELDKRLMCGSVRKVRLNGVLQQKSSDAWELWTPDYTVPSLYSFTIPERKLPELPYPYVWGYDGQNELCVEYLNGDFRTYPFPSRTACDERKKENELYAALIEEFETRPK